MNYRYGKRKKLPITHKLVLLLPIGLTLLAGLYLIILLVTPRLSLDSKLSLGKLQSFNISEIPISQHQILIPKIGVSIDFLTGSSQILERAAWHRLPERGNPEIGGNFIISAHRFSLGWTPEQTKQKSPFYNINKIDIGDSIYIDYKGKRYTYKVTKRYRVEPNMVSIEAPSDEAKLTLYSCTLKGSQDGREVIEAIPA